MSLSESQFESLLVRDRALRALACGLLADAHAAEDVTQEAWLAALRHGEGALSLPRWLAGAVKNLAAKVGRSARRRERREQDYARPEATPSGAEIVAREELRACVVAAVLALEEPYRASVLLRYFENLPPRAIAQRQGVPVETVRTRQKRALEMLRARLDREHGGRATWCVALLPFARPAPSSLASLPVLVMMSQTKLIAAGVATLALAGLYLALREREQPLAPLVARDETLVDAAEAVQPAASELGATAASSAREALMVAPPAGTLALEPELGSLRVTATWFDATPAAGVHARIQVLSQESPGFRARQAVTDEHGVFVLEQVAPGKTSVMLDRECAGKVDVQAGAEATLALQIPRGLDVEGVVVDREGAPVADAELWLSEINTMTGAVVGRSRADGSFRLRSCATPNSLGARAEGHAPSLLVELGGEDGTTVPVRLVLLGVGGEVAVRVFAPDGTPVAGAAVLVGSERMEFRRIFVAGEGELTGTGAAPALARTGADGRVLTGGIAPGRTPLVVRADGLALWRGEIEVREHERATLDVPLFPEARLSGHVRDGQGQPVARAYVRLQNRFGNLDPSCETRADGSFSLAGLAPGPIEVTAQTNAMGRASTTLVARAGDELTWEAVVGLGLELRGRLLDEDGAALAGWWVEIEDVFPAPPADHGSARSDAEGRFTLAGLHDRPHRLEVRAPGAAGSLASVAFAPVRPTSDEQVFRVGDADRPSARIRGIVVDELGNVPSALQLELARLDAGISQILRAHEGGRFELGPYSAGSYVLRVRAAGHPEHLLGPRQIAPGETWDCGVITLRPAGALVVRLRRAPGTASLQPWFRILRGSFDLQKLEPAGEVWRCEALAPGSWRLRMAGGGVAAALVLFEIQAGDTTELELPLVAGLQREIRVASSAGDGHRRPLLRVRSAAGEVVLEDEMWARAPGDFRHEPCLAPGLYRVEVELGDGPRAAGELEVAAGVPAAGPLLLTLP